MEGAKKGREGRKRSKITSSAVIKYANCKVKRRPQGGENFEKKLTLEGILGVEDNSMAAEGG